MLLQILTEQALEYNMWKVNSMPSIETITSGAYKINLDTGMHTSIHPGGNPSWQWMKGGVHRCTGRKPRQECTVAQKKPKQSSAHSAHSTIHCYFTTAITPFI